MAAVVTGDTAVIQALMEDLPDLAPLIDRPTWHRQAACRGHDLALWFPERGDSTEPGKAICRTCPVSVACYVAGEREHGTWGGASSGQRRKALRATAA